ncbi:MAG: AtpZ/AtpI family protein [Saprospiraceae bacterium]|jgi:F0F1-type ATP synthase assembly protein I
MSQNPPEQNKRAPGQAILRYSGMAFQLLGACLVGVFIGKKLDAHFQLEKPLWAVLLTILFMVASLVSIFRQLLRDS